MGMYTGLRLKGIVKEEYRPVIYDLMESDVIEDWSDLMQLFNDLEFIGEFSTLSRSSFIPFGSLSYMPNSWEIGEEGWITEFDYDTGYWQFQCSLKNYDSEIQVFLDTVANIIMESIEYVEVHYEEDRYGHIFELVNGYFIENESKMIDYRPWEDEKDNYWS